MFIFLDLVALFRLSVSSSISLLVNFIILLLITPEKPFIDISDVNYTAVVCMDPAFSVTTYSSSYDIAITEQS